MNTPFKEVYDTCLSKISDPFYTSELGEADLFQLMKSAMAKFPYPYCDFSKRDVEMKTFLFPLSDLEVEILGSLMALEWAQRAVMDIDALRPQYTTVEFKTSSTGYHLRALEKVLSFVQRNVEELVDRYAKTRYSNSPDEMSKWGGGGL